MFVRALPKVTNFKFKEIKIFSVKEIKATGEVNHILLQLKLLSTIKLYNYFKPLSYFPLYRTKLLT